jgi:hypothetical protein
MVVDSAACPTVKPSTLEAMERWVRWRNGVGPPGGTSGQRVGGGGNLLGRLQAARRHKTCPHCHGAKRIRVPGNPVQRTCPSCGGSGTVPEDLKTRDRFRLVPCDACRSIEPNGERGRPTGEVNGNGRTCIRCKGSGERLMAERYVHPATIPGTRIFGRDDPDPIAALINRTVIGWQYADQTWWMYRVVMERYCPDGPEDGRSTQECMAAIAGISPQFFGKMLKQAHLRIQEALETRV